jgi:hypothetical protein
MGRSSTTLNPETAYSDFGPAMLAVHYNDPNLGANTNGFNAAVLGINMESGARSVQAQAPQRNPSGPALA